MDKRSKKAMVLGCRTVLAALGICALVLLTVVPFSCKLTEEGMHIILADKTAPQIITFDITQRSVLEMECTEPVILKNVAFRSADASTESAMEVQVSYDATKTTAIITLPMPTEIGVVYELTGIAEDMNGNTLTFSLPFTGYNDNLPYMILTELRTAGTKAAPEYIELYVLKGGNAAGMEIWSANDGKDKNYCFPPIAVQTGEYVVVHYRTDSHTPDYCISETGDDLTLATPHDNNDNCNMARDLWAENEDNGSRINDNDIILLTCDNGTRVMDAVIYAKSTLKKWSTTQAEYAKLAEAKGLWPSAELAEAACNDGAATTQTLCRQNVAAIQAAFTDETTVIPASKDDWFVVKKSKATPGLPNSDEPYGN